MMRAMSTSTRTSPPEGPVGDWTDLANCVGVDAELMFPDRWTDPADAKAVCAGCEVREQCLAQALANGERYGVWGGLTPDERRVLAGFRRPPRRRHHQRHLRSVS
jgi:WhiB family redox-sensing transcriptional regulator